MNLAVVFAKRKKLYGPIARALLDASREKDFFVKFVGDDLKGFDNIILFVNRPYIMPGQINANENAKVGWWMCDYRTIKELEHQNIPDYVSYIFLCNTQLMEDYKTHFKKPVYYMPQCGFRFDRAAERNYIRNIVFIGHTYHLVYHSNRLDYIFSLKKFGVTHINKHRVTKEMSDLYHKTPISLSISLPLKGYTSNRLYNILAAEGFAMVLYYPEMEKQFTNHEHLVWFNDKQELNDLVEYYLSHEQERKLIAQNGRQLFLEKHTAESRIQNMFDIMNGQTESFYGYL